tara:strand:+ start:2340 stop:2900 length:561 start_codon:yes stop_codon:yes gene_type:complete
MSLPNVITGARILFVPAFVVVYMMPGSWSHPIAALIFSLAAATDWLDGYVARRFNQVTAFGAFLDPVADKIIVVSALLILVAAHSSIWLTLPSLIIVGRELVVSALREWMAEMDQSITVAVSYLGKIKTTVQMIAIAILMYLPSDAEGAWIVIGYATLYVAAVMTIWSMSVYLRAAWPTLRNSDPR